MIETFLLFHKPYWLAQVNDFRSLDTHPVLSTERVLSILLINFGCYGYLRTTRAVPMATIYPFEQT